MAFEQRPGWEWWEYVGKESPRHRNQKGQTPWERNMFSVLRNAKEALCLEQSGQRERGKGNEFEDVARGLGQDLGFYFKCAASYWKLLSDLK